MKSISSFTCLSLFFSTALFAQPAPPKILAGNGNLLPTTIAIDPVGQELRTLQATLATKIQPKQGEQFLSTADQARAFRAKYPDRPEAVQAKSLEAKSLLLAAMAADNSQPTRIAALVADVRGDLRLPAKDRLDVVALSETVRLQSVSRDPAQILTATESSVRNLIAEFPQEPGGYEALFRLAEAQPDESRSIILAREIMDMPAPTAVKDMVQVFLDRQALVGQSLPKIADTAIGSANVISAVQGKPIILYTWASWNPGSIALAKSLNTRAPVGAVLIGVNLDSDVATAKSLAQAESLPGRQIFDARGLDSPFVHAMKLTTAAEVYVTNARGEIREVAAQRGDFKGKFASAIR